MGNVSSEQELLKLLKDGKITEDEYKQLLDAMRKSPPNDSQEPVDISSKYILWIGLAAVVVVAALFLTSVIFDSDKTEKKTVADKPTQERIVDKIDYSFINDPELIGTWKSVDFVQAIDDFKAGEKHWRGDLFLKNMMFFDDGRTTGPWTWTKGLIIHHGNKTAAKYLIKEINGEKYLFFEWKTSDYTIQRMKPKYYVLKKEISEEEKTD